MKKRLWLVCFIIILSLTIGCSSELEDDDEYTMMPVFRNHFHMIPSEIAEHEGVSKNGLSFSEMTDMAVSTLLLFGENTFEQDSVPNGIWLEAVTFSTGNIEITVEENGFMQIYFFNGYELPNDIVFSWEEVNDEAIKFLTEYFAPIIGIEPNPSEIEQLFNLNGTRVRFMPNEHGLLSRIDKLTPISMLLKDKVGYFPIITESEAKERMLLGQGSFGVDMGQALPTIDEVTSIQLVYFGHSLGQNWLEFFAPWYQISIQRDNMDYEMAYFVPAIKSSYLEQNPAWAIYPHQ